MIACSELVVKITVAIFNLRITINGTLTQLICKIWNAVWSEWQLILYMSLKNLMISFKLFRF